METIKINASKTYDVLIGTGLLDEAGEVIRKTIGGKAAAVVTDDNVEKLYGKRLADSLAKNSYRTVQYVFPHGESSKNAGNFLSLLNFLAKEKLSRTDVIVALG